MQDLNTGTYAGTPVQYEEGKRNPPQKQQGVILFEGQMVDIKSQSYRIAGLQRKKVIIEAWEADKPELSRGETVFIGKSAFVVESVGSTMATLRGLPGTRFKEGTPY